MLQMNTRHKRRRCVYGSLFVLAFYALGFQTALSADADSIAVIIGNSDYADERVPDVDYAHRDADAFRAYVEEVLGYREGNIIDLRDATQAELFTTFGNESSPRGLIWQYIRPGISDVVVFYSGHGVPGLEDRRGYLLPSNANPATVDINGYPIDLLYENLSKLDARSVTVYLDACFSGDSHAGMLIRSASPVFVSADLPEAADDGLTVLTAASGEQLASWDEEREHGLFTGYLMDGLYGAADAEGIGNQDGQVSVSEVKAWLDREMTYTARRQYRRVQEATVLGNPDRVLSAVPDFTWIGEQVIEAPEDEIPVDEAQTASRPPEQLLTPESEPSFTVLGADEVLYVQTRSNIRSGPGTDYDPPIAQLEAGDEVHVTGRVEGLDWFRIALADGGAAFIFAPLLGANNPIPPEPVLQSEQVAVRTDLTPGTVFQDCEECPQMVVVPAGSFIMGSLEHEEGRHSNEGPTREVRIPNPFAVGVYEITFNEWDACVAAGGCNEYRPYDGQSRRGPRPVVGVSWKDSQDFVEWLSVRTGVSYRLLSETEWEYTARAGTQTAYWWGDEFDHTHVSNGPVTNDPDARFASIVGSHDPNAFGVYDMHGNVWEWTQDCWNGSYDGGPTDGSAWTSGNCDRRVRRGGAYGYVDESLRSANRSSADSETRSGSWGFRVARELNPSVLGEEASCCGDQRSVPEGPNPDHMDSSQSSGQLLESGTQHTSSPVLSDEGAGQAAVRTGYSPGTVFEDCEGCPQMVVVPAGSFMMGSSSVETGRNENEGPEHEVHISEPFAVGVYEVTVAEWEACVQQRLCNERNLTSRSTSVSDEPVNFVSWADTQDFITWISVRTGQEYRLLSEAEWEFVARAGTQTRYWWGDGWSIDDRTMANWNGMFGQPQPIGSFPANPFGLYDVIGNVTEWTQDCWNDNYVNASSDGSPSTSGNCNVRVLRGGAWSDSPTNSRSAYRLRLTSDYRSSVFGFRVARNID